MCPKLCSLATHLNRPIVFDHLRLCRDGLNKVPSSGVCPLCQDSALEVHWDEANIADWAYCSACGFAGDLIELTAAYYGEGVAAACARLNRRGALPSVSDEELDAYLTTHIGRRKDLEIFWKQASARMSQWEYAELYGPFEKLELDHRDLKSFASQLSPWMGIANKQELEDLWHPASYELRPRRGQVKDERPRRGAGPGASRLFRGKGWEDVLVLRCTDLPGTHMRLNFHGPRRRSREWGHFLTGCSRLTTAGWPL